MDTSKIFLEGHITLGTVADDGAGESKLPEFSVEIWYKVISYQ
jgi:hypothetical protein